MVLLSAADWMVYVSKILSYQKEDDDQNDIRFGCNLVHTIATTL